MEDTADVVIVGAGPSGLTVACELALAGVGVTVLERRSEPVGSRASTVMPRVLELLHMRGLLGRFLERGHAIQDGALLPTHSWAGISPLVWKHLDTPFPYRLLLAQNHTEELLKAHAIELGVNVREGVTVTGLSQGPDSVQVQCDDGSSYKASYVVGADGGRSSVRNAVGISFPGHDGTMTGVVADAVLDYPSTDSSRMTFSNEHGWLSVLSISEGQDITRFVFVHAERMHAGKSEPVTPAEVQRCVEQISGMHLEIEELEWSSRTTDAMRLADRFRQGRVLLVGESTRIHYPASGVGMNFCIQDAFNLAWKLAAVINGHAHDGLLDSYERERRPFTEKLLESVRAQCAIHHNFQPGGMAVKQFIAEQLLSIPEVHRRMAADENGLLLTYEGPDGVASHPLCGRPAPNVTFVSAVGQTHILEYFRDGKFVLLDCTGRAGWDSRAVADGQLRLVSAPPSGEAGCLEGVTALLLRPDGYVAYVGTGSDELESGLKAMAAVLNQS